MDVRVGLERKMRAKELMLLNCGVGEDSWESLGLKEIQPVHPKRNQPCMFIERTDAEGEIPILWPTWCEEPTYWKRPWCWKRLKEGGEGDDRGWDGWMASPTQWTWVWVNSWSWWWTGRPGVLQSMGSQSQTRLTDLTELILHRYFLLCHLNPFAVFSMIFFELLP